MKLITPKAEVHANPSLLLIGSDDGDRNEIGKKAVVARLKLISHFVM